MARRQPGRRRSSARRTSACASSSARRWRSWRVHVEVRGTIAGTQAALAAGILAVVFVWGGVAVLNAIQYWRDVVGYARSGRLPLYVAPTVHADVESPAPEPGGAHSAGA